MPINNVCYISIVNEIRNHFNKEILFYTHPDVKITPHAVSAEDTENWTQKFFEEKIIPSLPQKGSRFIELERTLTGLYCFTLFVEKLNFKDAYDAFIDAQKHDKDINENEILTEVNFKLLHERINAIINNDPDKKSILTYLILYSDLGKSPAIRESLKDSDVKIDLSLDPDDLMAEILKKFDDSQIEKILPSFSYLSKNAKSLLKEIYPIMRACFGHLYFLERGQKTLEVISKTLITFSPEQRQQVLELIYLAQFFDAAGAKGQQKIAGSLTCTNHFFTAYRFIDAALKNLKNSLDKEKDIEKTVKPVFQNYLEERAAQLGFPLDSFSIEEEFLTRVGCLLRCERCKPQFEIHKILQEEFQKLPDTQKILLKKQFNFEGAGLEKWTKTHYIGTPAINLAQTLLAEGNIHNAVAKALQGLIFIALLVEKTAENFSNEVHDENRSISFGEVAFLAATKPDLFNDPEELAKNYVFDPVQNKIIYQPSIQEAEKYLLTFP